jgi:flagellar biosynthesis/type III secretory pathway chaperone
MKESLHLATEVTIDEVQTIILQETLRYEELLDCLEKEREALVAQQTDDLFSLVMAKSKILQQLLEARQERKDTLIRLGVNENGNSGGPPWVRDLLSQHRKRLAGLNVRIIGKNAQNRELVVDSLEVIQQFVDILTGANQRPQTYQRQGLLKNTKTPARFNYKA